MEFADLKKIVAAELSEWDTLEAQVMGPELVKRNPKKYAGLMRKYQWMQEVQERTQRYEQRTEELTELRKALGSEKNDEMLALYEEEIARLESDLEGELQALQILLVPADPLDEKNIIMEIRAGTGGDEAALFAADLYRMYQRYSERNSWKVELLSLSEQEQGGFKEIIFQIKGSSIYRLMRYESGSHRVQRIPVTESQGRIHTSVATVAVLPEAEEMDVSIDEKDLRIDTYRSSGAGGQHVNTTDSAVRITHLPTNFVVQCQDERSQTKNLDKAMKMLRSRLLAYFAEQAEMKRAEERKEQVGSGDRSGRIRTYNYPQNRVTDHRIGLTLYKLDQIMEGALDELIQPLRLKSLESLNL